MRAASRVLLVALAFSIATPAGATIRYRISLANPQQHFLRVTMVVPGAQTGIIAQLPAWNALYQIRDFAHRVIDVRAMLETRATTAASSRVIVSKLDKQTWQIDTSPTGQRDDSLTIDYAIYWDEPGPFSTQLNTHHAFINLAEILFYVPDRRGEDTRVEFADVPSRWKIAIELPSGDQPNSFTAPSYDALVDAPVEIGAFEEFRFEEGAARYRVVVDGSNWEQKKLGDEVRRIVGYQTTLMGGPPFREYTFFFHFGSQSEVGGGGMEHANSTAIAVESGTAAAAVAAHEFFHLWNVKRVRPQSLEPVDYTREQYTRALWFAEGVTSTYGAYTLMRGGLWDRKQFYEDLADELAELEAHPARLWQSVEEASLDTWLDKYPFYRRPDASVSYYNKGKIVGELFDLRIRKATENRKSLDDVLRALNDQFAKKGRFYRDSTDIRAVAENICACSLTDFFARYVAGADEIPYEDFLALAGLQLKKTTRSLADLGFWPGRGPENSIVVSEVVSGSTAEAAGLRQGDVLIELNGASFPRNIFRWLRDHKPGETIRLRFRRNKSEQEVSFALGERVEYSYQIQEDGQASEQQRRIREGWLRGTTN